MKRRNLKDLTPLEIQAKMGGGKMRIFKEDGKVIRFYANIQPRTIMDDLTKEDLLEAGFVNFRYQGTKDPQTLKFATVESGKYMVHQSVPVARSFAECENENCPYPLIRYELGYGWEAKHGAMRYPLRNAKELADFMRIYRYTI